MDDTCNMLHREQRGTPGSSCRTWDSQDDGDSSGSSGATELSPVPALYGSVSVRLRVLRQTLPENSSSFA